MTRPLHLPVCLGVLLLFGPAPALSAAEESIVRIGISPGTWWGVNPDDASAAIRAWSKIFIEQRSISIRADARMFESNEALVHSVTSGELEGAGMPTGQFLELENRIQTDGILVITHGGHFTETYVLVSHVASGITNLSQVAGKTLILQMSARTSLAPYWLESLLAGHSLPEAERAFKTIRRAEKPSKAALEVFFRESDLALITLDAFEVACEMNPQLRRQLQIIERSEPVIPSLFFFLSTYQGPQRGQIEQAILTMQTSLAGMQILTVFQGDGMVKLPTSALAQTRNLVEKFHTLCPHLAEPLFEIKTTSLPQAAIKPNL